MFNGFGYRWLGLMGRSELDEIGKLTSIEGNQQVHTNYMRSHQTSEVYITSVGYWNPMPLVDQCRQL